MKKLRLDVDALQVESFDPEAREAPRRGTVDGHLVAVSGYEIYTPCCYTANLQQSCYNTCKASCYGTCNQATCYDSCEAVVCPSHHATECNCGSADFTACCV